MSMLDENQGQLPLLVGFSVRRTGNDTLPGHYDAEQQIWVVDAGHGVKPIIEVARDLCELSTKTFVKSERDDVESMAFFEITTKTDARPERDDVTGNSLIALLELMTKTKAEPERDD